MKQKLSSLLAYVCIFVSGGSLIYYSKDIAKALEKLNSMELISLLINILDITAILLMLFYLIKLNAKVDRQPDFIMDKMTNNVIKMFKKAFRIIKKNGNLL